MRRALHWALVAAFVGAYASGDDGWLPLHEVVGYVLLGLVVRVLCGVWGARSARSSQLGFRLSAVHHDLRQLCWLERPRYGGPGAAGGVVLALWLGVILLAAGTGLFLYSGLLAQWTAGTWLATDALEAAHAGLAAATIVLALFHVAGILLESFLHRDKETPGCRPRRGVPSRDRPSAIGGGAFALLSVGLVVGGLIDMRSPGHLASEARQEAWKFLQSWIAQCGGSHYSTFSGSKTQPTTPAAYHIVQLNDQTSGNWRPLGQMTRERFGIT